MNNLLFTYALIKSLYDQGDDYIDSFVPFTIQVIDGNEYSDTSYIQSKVLDTCGLSIPLHVLGTILKRTRKRGYLEYKLEWSGKAKRELYKLTPKGIKYIDELEEQENVERRINDLLGDIVIFFGERKIPVSAEEVLALLLSILHENSQPLREFLNPSSATVSDTWPKNTNIDILIEYLKIAEQQRPDKYQTIQDILFGSIISTILSTGEEKEIHDLITRKFRHCRVYLDTNFVLSILELRPSGEIVEGAKELFQLIRNCYCPIRVFDFTVGEIARVLSSYFTDDYRYSNSIIVDDVCSSLKRNGWTKTQLREYIANIEITLKKMGIEVELKRNINLKTFNPANPELRSRIIIYKKEQNLLSQNHDLAAVETIRDIRRYSVRQIEFAKAIFLTSDAGLSRFSFEEMGHKDNKTISEVILDRLLTNIIWLKMPHSKPTLKSIIASHSRNLFIKGRIWSKFYDILSKLKQEEEIKDENISMLFYHGYIEDSLSHFEDHQTNAITRKFVLEEIEKASKFYEEDVDKKLIQKESEFLDKLRRGTSKIERKKSLEKDQEWLEKISVLKDNIKIRAKNIARRRINILRITVSVALALPLIIVLIINDWKLFGQVANITAILIFILLILGIAGGSIRLLWDKLEEKFLNDIYLQRIAEVGLDKY